MTELAACPQCGHAIPGDLVQCNVCNAVIRGTAVPPPEAPAQPTKAEELSARIGGLREDFRTRHEANAIDAQEISQGALQGGRIPSSPAAAPATTSFRTKTGMVTTLLLAATIAATTAFLLPVGDRTRTQQVESILEVASDSNSTRLDTHVRDLSSRYGSTTVDDWILAGARQSLAAASRAVSPVDAANDFRRAATLLGSMNAPSVEVLEVAADAMNRAGDCHCELNDATAARTAFSNAEAGYVAILASDEGSTSLRKRIEEKTVLTRRIIERGCSTP